jgi:hypothetical protein
MRVPFSSRLSTVAPWAVAVVLGLLAALAVPPQAKAFDPDKPWRTTKYLNCTNDLPNGHEKYEYCDGSIVFSGPGTPTRCFIVVVAGDCL